MAALGKQTTSSSEGWASCTCPFTCLQHPPLHLPAAPAPPLPCSTCPSTCLQHHTSRRLFGLGSAQQVQEAPRALTAACLHRAPSYCPTVIIHKLPSPWIHELSLPPVSLSRLPAQHHVPPAAKRWGLWHWGVERGPASSSWMHL